MNWDYLTFIPLLYEACRITTGPVVELGVGCGSTPMLHALVTYGVKPRNLLSVDDDAGWLEVMRSRVMEVENPYHTWCHVQNWEDNLRQVAEEGDGDGNSTLSVVFIDCGPPSNIPLAKDLRRRMTQLFKKAEVIVVHDYSNISSNDSEFENLIYTNFRYRYVDYHTTPSSIWLSNTKMPEFMMKRISGEPLRGE